MRLMIASVIAPVLAVVAAEAPQPGEPLRFINPPDLARPTGYTHVVDAGAGRTVYIAGQVALDADGNLVGKGDFRAQVEQVFRNLEAALAAADLGFPDVVKLNTYVADMSALDALREVRARYVGDRPPASTLVQVVRLAREDFLVEIEAIAAAPGRPRLMPVR